MLDSCLQDLVILYVYVNDNEIYVLKPTKTITNVERDNIDTKITKEVCVCEILMLIVSGSGYYLTTSLFIGENIVAMIGLWSVGATIPHGIVLQ